MSGDEGSPVFDEEGNFLGMTIATSNWLKIVSKAENIEKALAVITQKEYRDRHWKQCRFGLDPRKCGRWELRNGKWVWADGCFATRERDGDDELHNYCMRDDQACDAKWEE